ncbi:MAG: FtsX-like permease family protein [Owenweeksia sp.]|nr:FtsX-like permease family protein [Owenweeksia sp.]
MNFSSYIARRYFFAKSSRNAVNIISGISILGILVGTLALIIVLSAFNGLERLVGSFYQSFDPDLKVLPATGKYFEAGDAKLEQWKDLEGVADFSGVLEERVLMTYQDKEYIGTVKGVDSNYISVTQIEESMRNGTYQLWISRDVPGTVLGAGVSYFLGYGRLFFEEPIQLFVPRAGATAANFNQAFSSQSIYPTGIFSVQPEYDEKYAIAPLHFVQNLLHRPAQYSSIELRVSDGHKVGEVKRQLQRLLGDTFVIKNRQEQQAVFMKVMKSESLFTFLVFALILTIASFTIMGSLSMMMLDKKSHLRTLWAMGAELKTLRLVFFKEGMLISGAGAGLGLLLGVVVVLGQQYFGWVKLGEGYVVEAYPMVLRWLDVLLVISTVAVLCGLTSWLTSRRLNHSLITSIAD